MNHFSCTLLVLFSQVWAAYAGRCRDPFISLPGTSVHQPAKVETERSPSQRPPGLKGIRITETSLLGIVSSEDLSLAILAGPDQFAYIVRVGSRLSDGSVLQISNSGILFAQSDESPPVFKPFRLEALK